VVSYPEQHQALLEAICSQDLKGAEQTTMKHVVDAALLALQGLSEDEAWERVAAFASHK
jgi:DNA-binding FadR family transcriptional regulator